MIYIFALFMGLSKFSWKWRKALKKSRNLMKRKDLGMREPTQKVLSIWVIAIHSPCSWWGVNPCSSNVHCCPIVAFEYTVKKTFPPKESICKENIVQQPICNEVLLHSVTTLKWLITMGSSALQLILYSQCMIENEHLSYQHLWMSS